LATVGNIDLLSEKFIAYNKKARCTNIIESKNLGKFLYKIKCKYENQQARIVQILEEEGETTL